MPKVDNQTYKDYALQTLDQMAHWSLTELKPLGKRIDINVNTRLHEDWGRVCPIDEEYLEDFESQEESDARWLAESAMYEAFLDNIDFDVAYFVWGMKLLEQEDCPIVMGLTCCEA
jgi:hypothetical protein